MGGVVDPPTPIPIDNTTVPLPLLGPFPRFLILGEKFRDLGHAPSGPRHNGCLKAKARRPLYRGLCPGKGNTEPQKEASRE